MKGPNNHQINQIKHLDSKTLASQPEQHSTVGPPHTAQGLRSCWECFHYPSDQEGTETCTLSSPRVSRMVLQLHQAHQWPVAESIYSIWNSLISTFFGVHFTWKTKKIRGYQDFHLNKHQIICLHFVQCVRWGPTLPIKLLQCLRAHPRSHVGAMAERSHSEENRILRYFVSLKKSYSPSESMVMFQYVSWTWRLLLFCVDCKESCQSPWT